MLAWLSYRVHHVHYRGSYSECTHPRTCTHKLFLIQVMSSTIRRPTFIFYKVPASTQNSGGGDPKKNLETKKQNDTS